MVIVVLYSFTLRFIKLVASHPKRFYEIPLNVRERGAASLTPPLLEQRYHYIISTYHLQILYY